MIDDRIPQIVLVSPVVSLDDIENAAKGAMLEPTSEHVINREEQIELYRGENPWQWLSERGYMKVGPPSELCRASFVDGWYERRQGNEDDR